MVIYIYNLWKFLCDDLKYTNIVNYKNINIIKVIKYLLTAIKYLSKAIKYLFFLN